jgi:hypothetical protein
MIKFKNYSSKIAKIIKIKEFTFVSGLIFMLAIHNINV